MSSYFTPEEALFIRTVMKGALADLNAARQKLAASDNMIDLMKTEQYLADAESAWEKVKGML